MKKIYLIITVLIIAANVSFSQNNSGKIEKKQFLYLLRLEKTMQDTSAWSAEKQQVVAAHFAHLQKMLQDGILILAGKTSTDLATTFGIVVFEADSFESAKVIAENDPAVIAKIMNVEVFPYEVALIRNKQ